MQEEQQQLQLLVAPSQRCAVLLQSVANSTPS